MSSDLTPEPVAGLFIPSLGIDAVAAQVARPLGCGPARVCPRCLRQCSCCGEAAGDVQAAHAGAELHALQIAAVSRCPSPPSTAVRQPHRSSQPAHAGSTIFSCQQQPDASSQCDAQKLTACQDRPTARLRLVVMELHRYQMPFGHTKQVP